MNIKMDVISKEKQENGFSQSHALEVKHTQPDLTSNSANAQSPSDVSRKFSKQTPLSLTWSDLRFGIDISKGLPFKKVTTEKVILDNLNGGIKSGEFVAVMGTSGAGKTAFMNIMSGRTTTGNITGKILLDGKPRDKNFKKYSAYVEQDDVFLPTFTVKETFIFNSLLRLPKKFSYEQKKERAQVVMNELGLSSCKDVYIGNEFIRGISGGERKRCAIGIELITNPRILFLDEPTSGLDAFTAYHVMSTIQKLAGEGNRAVMCTIHQPRSNIYDLFDKLLLLSKGKTVFYGQADQAPTFFRNLGYEINYSPADFFLDITTVDVRTPEAELETTKRNEELLLAYNESEYMTKALQDCGTLSPAQENESTNKSEEIMESPESTHEELNTEEHNVMDVEKQNKKDKPIKISTSFQLGWWAEFSLLYKRAFQGMLRLNKVIIAMYAQFIVMALLVGIIFYQLTNDQLGISNRQGVLFFTVMMMSMTPLMNKINLFHKEKPLFHRERAAGIYRVSTFYLSKSFAEFPLGIWGAFIFGAIAYWMVGLNPLAERFFYYLFILFILYFTAEGFGLLISAITPNVEVANATSPMIIIIFMLFGGFYININSVPDWLSWIQYISFVNWAFRAMCINEFVGLTFTCASPTNCQRTGEIALETLGFAGDSKYLDTLYLFLVGLVVRIFAYFALLFLNKPKSKLI